MGAEEARHERLIEMAASAHPPSEGCRQPRTCRREPPFDIKVHTEGESRSCYGRRSGSGADNALSEWRERHAR